MVITPRYVFDHTAQVGTVGVGVEQNRRQVTATRRGLANSKAPADGFTEGSGRSDDKDYADVVGL